jgi:Na+-transporting NADH:ubiquinone oxidoreductase subunit NqrF
MKMPMRMAVTKVLCCLVRIAILMNAMPVSVLAMNSNNASNSVSNHSYSSVCLSSNVIYVPDAKDNRASPKQCNITAVSAPGSAIFDTGEENYTYPCKGSGGHSEYVKKLNEV